MAKVASLFVRWSPERAVRVRALAGFGVFLGHPGVQMGTGEFNAAGNPVMD